MLFKDSIIILAGVVGFSSGRVVENRAAAPTATLSGGAVVVGLATSVPSSSVIVDAYLGIPYGTQTQRFKPAVAASSISSPFYATSYGPACIQQIPSLIANSAVQVFLNSTGALPTQSEDCLSINVWTPTGGVDNKPVLFYIHGGALTLGYSGQMWLDGSSFAANQDVVIVTFNYRLNVFGFPGSSQLAAGQGNVGFLDQRLALDWVQNNIASFGGNPAKVTIFGQSSGAASVDRLLLTAGSNPPFRAAILQSGQATVSPLDAVNNWSDLVEYVGCIGSSDELACVQAVDVGTIQNIINTKTVLFEPSNDGVTQLSTPQTVRRSLGGAASVPLMVGTLAQEDTVFIAEVLGAVTNLSLAKTELNTFLAQGSLLNPVIEQYVKAGLTVFDAVSQVATYYTVQCPISLVAGASNTAGNPTWRYYLDASFSNTQPNVPGFPYLGAYHTSDIPLIWGTFPTAGATSQEIALSKYMQTAWATFAKNPTSGPGWNQVGPLGNNVACLGCNGGTGTTMISEASIDIPCTAFDLAYPLFTSIGI